MIKGSQQSTIDRNRETIAERLEQERLILEGEITYLSRMLNQLDKYRSVEQLKQWRRARRIAKEELKEVKTKQQLNNR